MFNFCHMKRFRLILPVDSQNVTKNLTGHRMHVAGPQIYQINRWNNSFQSMYGMNRQQLTVWPGKLISCTKKNTFSYFGYLTLEGPGCQTVDTRSTAGVVLKTLGYSASN